MFNLAATKKAQNCVENLMADLLQIQKLDNSVCSDEMAKQHQQQMNNMKIQYNNLSFIAAQSVLKASYAEKSQQHALQTLQKLVAAVDGCVTMFGTMMNTKQFKPRNNNYKIEKDKKKEDKKKEDKKKEDKKKEHKKKRQKDDSPTRRKMITVKQKFVDFCAFYESEANNNKNRNITLYKIATRYGIYYINLYYVNFFKKYTYKKKKKKKIINNSGGT